MPSAGQISFVFDQTRMRWMTSLTSGRFQPPLSLTEGNTVDFVFRLSNNGTLFTPPLSPVWIFGIKDATTPNGDFLIQVNSATVASGVYTFVVELASAELQTWLATATSQSYAAIQITDSANDIATAPLLCQITANQNDSGTTPTSANGTLSVAAGKTVTFPLSLTFPAAAGTNGYHLALLNSTTGTTEWVVDATGTTIATDPIWTAAGQLVYGTGTGTAAALAAGATTSILVGGGAGAPVWTIATGTGAPVRENAPTLIAPVLGAATATSINGAGIESTFDSVTLTTASARTIQIDSAGTVSLNLSGSIDTSLGAGTFATNITVARTLTLTSTGNFNATFPATGTVVMEGATQTLTNKSIDASQLTGVVAGQYGGTGVANTSKTITLGASLTTTGAGATTFALGASAQTYTFPTTTATMARTDAAQIFTGVQTVTGGMVINPPSGAGADNIFIGTAAGMAGKGALTTGAYNTLIGRDCGKLITSGAGNMCIGTGAGERITTGSNNMAVGTTALAFIGTSSNCVAIGYQALAVQTLGNNIGIGANAGSNATGGQRNTFIGADVVQTGVATGNYNTVIGSHSGSALTSGTNNVIIGDQAGTALTTGANNSSLGSSTAFSAVGATYQTAIGSGATCTANNQVMLGRSNEAVVVPGTLAVGGGTVVAKLRHGNATLVAGTVTVTDTAITANSRIWVNRRTDGGTLGDSYSITRSAGASFTITSKTANVTASLDTSVVTYLIIEP